MKEDEFVFRMLKNFIEKHRIPDWLGGLKVELFNSRVLVRHQVELEKARNAIEKRDLLIERWNFDEQSIILPAKRWEQEDRVASIFTFRSFLIILLSMLLVFPAIFILPYMVAKYTKRERLKKEIMKQQTIVRSTLPIPVNQDEYKEIEDTYWGQKFISNGIIFLKTSESF